MLKTRSSDRRQEKPEMKGTKPHSIVKNSAAVAVGGAAAAATKSIVAKKNQNQKQTVEMVKPKSAISGQRAEADNAAAKIKRIAPTVVHETPAKMRKSFAKNVDLMEAKQVKSPKNAPTIKVEIDAEVNINLPLEWRKMPSAPAR